MPPRDAPHRRRPQVDGRLVMPMSKAINAEDIQRELALCRKKRDQLIDQIHSLERQIWPLQDELRNVTAKFDQLADIAKRFRRPGAP
jgi:septal ring factor EnvC (AmiA/AmiB activator)